ncbi:MAG: sigma-54 dependent transcriptional regulator [Wenzhouxiangella sp.]|jgi:DNA-binding NtrC family response regulator|nr:sigma-54 dependent transcriptional regulator [Wenzhouxiangella sp.]MDR9453163.1 sigma-54 dependent transcriptional regulator [Wenzhouxiangella sp.]
MATASIMVVDDAPDIRSLVGEILTDEGYAVIEAADATEAREKRSRHQPDLILLDVWMPGDDGISLLREWAEAGALNIPVVMISGHGSVDAAVEATRLGAVDFIEKPVSMAKLLATIEKALSHADQRRDSAETTAVNREVMEPLGRSAAVQALRQNLEKVAEHSGPVLISGEPGVGKYQTARWVHAHGKGREGPFVSVNAERLVDDEHAEGLVLGLHPSHPGLIAQAAGGSVLIEDIAKLKPSLQAQLARWLEVQAGQTPPASAGVRLLATTSESLRAKVRAGRFDEGLYYQLGVLHVDVPPLRERRDDLPDLVRFYAEYYPARDGLAYRPFSVAAQNKLRQYDWPGNLRELRNLIQRILMMGHEGEVTVSEVERALASAGPAEHHPLSGDVPDWFRLPLREAREAFERDYLLTRLKAVDGSVGKLAEAIEMERTHLYRKLRQLGIDPKQV